MEADISIERAEQLLLDHTISPCASEIIPLFSALGRVSCDTVTAAMDQPPFPRSPLDGFAQYHGDLSEAGKDTPVTLHVRQKIYAGDFPEFPLAPGESARVMTGAPLPRGATCVVRQEDVDWCSSKGGAAHDSVTIYTPLGEFENFCFQGEDVKKDSRLIEQGTRFDAAFIGILASQGMETVSVYRRPRVCVLSTGSELSAPGHPLPPGKIYDSNRLLLSARSVEIGAETLEQSTIPGTGMNGEGADVGARVSDDPAEIAGLIERLLPSCDMLITTGGVSVGERDSMHEVGARIGGEVLFRGLAVKPGSPAFAMLKNGKVILCLSGNPFAAFVIFELLAAPALRKLAGEKDVRHTRAGGVMRSAFDKTSRGRRFIRARIDGGDIYIPDSGHESGKLSALAGCNCLIDVPAGNRGLKIGDPAEVVMF
ncbi:MAG: molybdopterin molybdotransferase MoeA [Peptococcaceae bacterium]|nr:molybdopterin molybdotransferase MoeA [Peptococcaceae bacterium]